MLLAQTLTLSPFLSAAEEKAKAEAEERERQETQRVLSNPEGLREFETTCPHLDVSKHNVHCELYSHSLHLQLLNHSTSQTPLLILTFPPLHPFLTSPPTHHSGGSPAAQRGAGASRHVAIQPVGQRRTSAAIGGDAAPRSCAAESRSPGCGQTVVAAAETSLLAVTRS